MKGRKVTCQEVDIAAFKHMNWWAVQLARSPLGRIIGQRRPDPQFQASAGGHVIADLIRDRLRELTTVSLHRVLRLRDLRAFRGKEFCEAGRKLLLSPSHRRCSMGPMIYSCS